MLVSLEAFHVCECEYVPWQSLVMHHIYQVHLFLSKRPKDLQYLLTY